MDIKMLQTVEDSHPSININEETGKPRISYDVGKFLQGEVYEVPDDRGTKLIKLGYAEAVEGGAG